MVDLCCLGLGVCGMCWCMLFVFGHIVFGAVMLVWFGGCGCVVGVGVGCDVLL